MRITDDEFKRVINNRNIRLGFQAKTREEKTHDGTRGKEGSGRRHGEADKRNDAGERIGFSVRGEGFDREAAAVSRQDSLYPSGGSGEGNLPGGVDNGLAEAKRGQRVRATVAKKTLATA